MSAAFCDRYGDEPKIANKGQSYLMFSLTMVTFMMDKKKLPALCFKRTGNICQMFQKVLSLAILLRGNWWFKQILDENKNFL